MPRLLDVARVDEHVLESIKDLLGDRTEALLSMNDIRDNMDDAPSQPVITESIARLADDDRLVVKRMGNRYSYSLPKRRPGRPRKSLLAVASTTIPRKVEASVESPLNINDLWKELAAHMMRAKHTIDKIEKQIPA